MSKYMFMTSGGQYEWYWEKTNWVVYDSKEDAVNALTKHMEDKGCKFKNLWLNEKPKSMKKPLLEVWNRHQADLNIDDVPMTGYVMTVEMHTK